MVANFSQAINPVSDMAKTDVSQLKQEILNQVTDLTGGEFKPIRLLSQSDYFGTGKVGAFHYLGKYEGRLAVLKIQAARPVMSETWMIQQFAAQNKSQIIRSPEIYQVFPWEEKLGYEAIIMEYASGQKVLTSQHVHTQNDIQKFFQMYQEYRQFSLNKPWLAKPTLNLDENFQNLGMLVKTVKPNSPFRKSQDLDLAHQAKKTLAQVWTGVELEFQHGHFSAEDLIYQGDQVILFSNLFWKWKMPFYDAVFAYHWLIFGLASVENITPEKIEAERQLWLTELANLPEVKKYRQQNLLNAALLERAVAGLLVDGLAYVDTEHPLAQYLIEAARNEVKRLIKVLET